VRLIFSTFLIVIICLTGESVRADTASTYDLVLGSYRSRLYAEEQLGKVRAHLDKRVHLATAVVDGVTWYRLIVEVGGDRAATEVEKQRLVKLGYLQAWRVPSVIEHPESRHSGRSDATDRGTERDEVVTDMRSPQTGEQETSAPIVSALGQPPSPVPDRKPTEGDAQAPVIADVLNTTAASLVGTGEGPIIEVPLYPEDGVQITLDGRLDEPIWQQVAGFDDMRVMDPDTMRLPRYRTDVKYLSTSRGLYIGAMMEQPPETLIARLSSRDSFINRDSIGITLDTSGEGLYGYWFVVNLGGSVLDGTVLAERQLQSEWDGPWSRATAELTDGWSTEMFLPWSMMSMPQVDGKRKIGFWTSRKVAHVDERWSSPPLPFTLPRFMSALGTLQLEKVDPGQQFALYPYGSYTYDDIAEEDEYRAGLDVFWRPSSNFQVTATMNPDFGAVESDDVVVNLTAFETFFPEKRLFFTEGSEVFHTTQRSRNRGSSSLTGGARQTTTFMPTPTTLLNTRRIGGAPNLVDVPEGVSFAGTELSRPTELLGAAKITGQAGSLRYGVLAAFEDDVSRVGSSDTGPVRVEQDGRDFGVARLLYETSGEGRMSVGYLGTMARRPDYDAVVHGVDAHFLSAGGKLSWDAQLINSDIDGEQGYGAFADFSYVPNRENRHMLRVDYFDEKLDISDLGFIRRNDKVGLLYGFNRSVSQGLEGLRNKRASSIASFEFNGDGRMVRGGLFLRNQWMFLDNTELRTELDYFPAGWDDRNSFGNGAYKTEERWVGEVSVGTDTGRKLSFSALAGMRQEELGGWTYRGSAGVTYKPNDRFSLDLDVNYMRRDGWLVYQSSRDFTTFSATDWQPRMAVDLFLSARQQLRLTMQWASIRAEEQEFWQVPLNDGDLIEVFKPPGAATDDFTISRLTTQLRYRWEIGPLSDLFVVYTRGSNLDNRVRDEFSDLLHDALITPVIDVFVVKLRYRFGS
jgi:hypothetical protein